MKIHVFVMLLAWGLICCKDFFQGDHHKKRQIYHVVKRHTITRGAQNATVYYNTRDASQINAIIARDNRFTKSGQVILVDGGVGFTFVNLLLKAPPGDSLDFEVYLYT